MKKLLLLLLCVPLIGLGQDTQIQDYKIFYSLEDEFKIISCSEKVRRGYISLEKELRYHFNVDDKDSLYFNDKLIGDLDGDQRDDFIILSGDERFLLKISNGQYFYISVNQTVSTNPVDPEEGTISVFFTHINNGVVEGVVEDRYYKESDDEWYYPISTKTFTLKELYKISKQGINTEY